MNTIVLTDDQIEFLWDIIGRAEDDFHFYAGEPDSGYTWEDVLLFNRDVESIKRAIERGERKP